MIAKTPAQLDLQGEIQFTIPDDRLDCDPEIYKTYDPTRDRPNEPHTVALTDLRPELELAIPVAEQVSQRGFAIARRPSGWIDRVAEAEGTEAYLAECREIIKRDLGCTRVLTWNSTCRKSTQDTFTAVPRQEQPEKDFVPTSRIQPVAGFAHVDQDAPWGQKVVGFATEQDPSTFKRSMIINIWRPLRGPVTSSPLCMLDYRTYQPEDGVSNATTFGWGIRVFRKPERHRWSYLRYQQSDEIVYLLCYDSDQGRGGQALFAAHAAAKIGEQDTDGIEPELVVPRESIEVRMIAVWE